MSTVEQERIKSQIEASTKKVDVEQLKQQIEDAKEFSEMSIEDIKKLKEEVKQKDATIQALQGMLGQMVPVVEAILPVLKQRPELDKQMLAQIERMTQIAKMMTTMGDVASVG